MKYEFECDDHMATYLLPVIQAVLTDDELAYDSDSQWKVIDGICAVLGMTEEIEFYNDNRCGVIYETRLFMEEKIAKYKRKHFERRTSKNREGDAKVTYCPACENYFNYGIDGLQCPKCGYELPMPNTASTGQERESTSAPVLSQSRQSPTQDGDTTPAALVR